MNSLSDGLSPCTFRVSSDSVLSVHINSSWINRFEEQAMKQTSKPRSLKSRFKLSASKSKKDKNKKNLNEMKDDSDPNEFTLSIRIPAKMSNAPTETTYDVRDDQQWMNSVKDLNPHQRSEQQAVYEKLVANVGIFRWQGSTGLHGAKQQLLSHIQPKYSSVKEYVVAMMLDVSFFLVFYFFSQFLYFAFSGKHCITHSVH